MGSGCYLCHIHTVLLLLRYLMHQYLRYSKTPQISVLMFLLLNLNMSCRLGRTSKFQQMNELFKNILSLLHLKQALTIKIYFFFFFFWHLLKISHFLSSRRKVLSKQCKKLSRLKLI